MKEFLRMLEAENLFSEAAAKKPTAAEKLVNRIANLKLPEPRNIDKNIYENHMDDVRQDFLIKILDGKVRWNKEQGKLNTYIYTILNNLWKDILRKRRTISVSVLKFDPASVEREDGMLYLSIKKERQRELCTLSRVARVVVKMWKPYIFQNFEADEKDFLNERAVDLGSLKQKLKENIDEAIRAGKDYISADVIAVIINMQRNTVDQHLSRSRKKMPWLGDLKNELE